MNVISRRKKFSVQLAEISNSHPYVATSATNSHARAFEIAQELLVSQYTYYCDTSLSDFYFCFLFNFANKAIALLNIVSIDFSNLVDQELSYYYACDN